MVIPVPAPSKPFEKKSKLQILTEDVLKKVEEDELDCDLDLDFDPSKPSLEDTVTAGHPFCLPWSREVRSILTGLDSTRLKDPGGPWVPGTPFDFKDIQLSAVIPDMINEGINGVCTTGYYRDGLSTASEFSKEHLSASLGVTVGYPFLSANVSGKYDREVTEDKNGIKASRNTSCRVGRVVLDTTPNFTEEAKALIQSGRGAEERFRELYGDFYISGFVLGADAGACLSAFTEGRSSQETLEITVTVKTLFYEKSFSDKQSTVETNQSSSVSFSGYSTLGGAQSCSSTLAAGGQSSVHKLARNYLDNVGGLHHQVGTIIKDLELVDGDKLSISDSARLCASGLVVELLLSPFARLNKYVECVGRRYEDPLGSQ